MLRAVAFAPVAVDQIEAALDEAPDAPAAVEDSDDAPSGIVSCAALLVKKVGLSEEHAILAAGFAGGIGLSGGACGALGAAVWILGMHHGKDGASFEEVNAKIGDSIERFLESSGYEFQCFEIVGRKFDGFDDHACHLRGGGCWKIIDALAASVQDELSRASAETTSEPG